PAAELIAQARGEIARLFPAAVAAELVDAFVTREPHATFRQQAGSGRYRPRARTAWPGLVLAGAWTDTGLRDTLEGAVRSGLRAAAGLGGRHAGRKSRAVSACGLESWPGHDQELEVMVR